MPITKTTGYKASDGQVYATVEEAQKAELESLFDEQGHPLIEQLMQHRDEVLDILTTGPRSRPNTRKKAGTTAPRRARARAATATEVSEGLKAMREAVDASLAAVS